MASDLDAIESLWGSSLSRFSMQPATFPMARTSLARAGAVQCLTTEDGGRSRVSRAAVPRFSGAPEGGATVSDLAAKVLPGRRPDTTERRQVIDLC